MHLIWDGHLPIESMDWSLLWPYVGFEDLYDPKELEEVVSEANRVVSTDSANVSQQEAISAPVVAPRGKFSVFSIVCGVY